MDVIYVYVMFLLHFFIAKFNTPKLSQQLLSIIATTQITTHMYNKSDSVSKRKASEKRGYNLF